MLIGTASANADVADSTCSRFGEYTSISCEKYSKKLKKSEVNSSLLLDVNCDKIDHFILKSDTESV